jgi:transcriptional regulator with XRE-family HTH domain
LAYFFGKYKNKLKYKNNLSNKFNMTTVNQRIMLLSELLCDKQADFARLIGISTAQLSNIKKDKFRPSFDVIEAIMENISNVNPYWLINGTGEMFLNDEGAPKPKLPSKSLDGGKFGDEVIAMLQKELEAYKDRERLLIEREKQQMEVIHSLSKR